MTAAASMSSRCSRLTPAAASRVSRSAGTTCAADSARAASAANQGTAEQEAPPAATPLQPPRNRGLESCACRASMCVPCIHASMCMPCIHASMCMPCIHASMCVPCIHASRCVPCIHASMCMPCIHASMCMPCIQADAQWQLRPGQLVDSAACAPLLRTPCRVTNTDEHTWLINAALEMCLLYAAMQPADLRDASVRLNDTRDASAPNCTARCSLHSPCRGYMRTRCIAPCSSPTLQLAPVSYQHSNRQQAFSTAVRCWYLMAACLCAAGSEAGAKTHAVLVSIISNTSNASNASNISNASNRAHSASQTVRSANHLVTQSLSQSVSQPVRQSDRQLPSAPSVCSAAHQQGPSGGQGNS